MSVDGSLTGESMALRSKLVPFLVVYFKEMYPRTDEDHLGVVLYPCCVKATPTFQGSSLISHDPGGKRVEKEKKKVD